MHQQSTRLNTLVLSIVAITVILARGAAAPGPRPPARALVAIPRVDVAATTTTAPPPPPPPPVSATQPARAVPTGKGMWIWQPDQAEGGDPAAIIARAQATGLSHLYVRTGSSVDGFVGAPFLDSLLPVAHAAGIRVIGWDFPYFDDVNTDVARALEAIRYVTPSGDRLDGFSADIETPQEGVALTAEAAAAYGQTLRNEVGPSFPLIATVPRPSPARQLDYPYAEVLANFDVVAPMVYWIDTPPDEDAAEAVDFLAQYGKSIEPVGQAYDSSLEGGPAGAPTGDEIGAFINTADAHGAQGVSFWSWQHADDEVWGAIAAGRDVGVPPAG
jgi:hypothetical protein